jgi:hypothetical protein
VLDSRRQVKVVAALHEHGADYYLIGDPSTNDCNDFAHYLQQASVEVDMGT